MNPQKTSNISIWANCLKFLNLHIKRNYQKFWSSLYRSFWCIYPPGKKTKYRPGKIYYKSLPWPFWGDLHWPQTPWVFPPREPLQRRRRKCHPMDIWNIPQGHQVLLHMEGVLWIFHNLHPPKKNQRMSPKKVLFQYRKYIFQLLMFRWQPLVFPWSMYYVDIFKITSSNVWILVSARPSVVDGWLKATTLLLGRPIYRGYVCFRKGKMNIWNL